MLRYQNNYDILGGTLLKAQKTKIFVKVTRNDSNGEKMNDIKTYLTTISSFADKTESTDSV